MIKVVQNNTKVNKYGQKLIKMNKDEQKILKYI
jgi:hypothetical protein